MFFFGFWSPSFHKFDMCMCLLQRFKANLCKSAHFTGTATDERDTELLHVFKVKMGKDKQTPTSWRNFFLTHLLFVSFSTLLLLVWSITSVYEYWREPDTFKTENKGNQECVWTPTLTGMLHQFYFLEYVLTDEAELFQYLLKKRKNM